MGVNDSIRAYNGVIGYINKNKIDLGLPKKKTYRAKEEYLNAIWIRFGKENNIVMEPNNSPKYRGSYSPMMGNCQRIQSNFKLFIKWIKENYKKEQSEVKPTTTINIRR